MKLDLLIRDGLVVDGSAAARGSIGVRAGRIVARWAEGEDLPAARRTIEAGGLLVFPGIVDPHVHFYGEGIGEYSRLAVMGGVTTFIGMVRGAPDETLPDVALRHKKDGERSSIADFTFHLVVYEHDDRLNEIGAVARGGYRSFKMFLAYGRRGMMVRPSFARRALREIRSIRGTALFHCENGDLIDALEDAAIASGRVRSEHYAPTRPPEAEAHAIDVVSFAAAETGCDTYVVHLSSAAGLAAIERARARGIPLWAETCPQYILLDESAMHRFGAEAKIAPPLRKASDCMAIGAALRMGTINTVGSDHASYSRAAKAAGNDNIFDAPFGMPGAPTLWPSMYTWAVESGIPLPHLVRAMAEMPARVFGLAPRKGTLQPGGDADIILVDPAAKQTVDAAAIWPHVSPSPMEGAVLSGWPQMTMCRGEIVWEDGGCVAESGYGRFLPQEPRG